MYIVCPYCLKTNNIPKKDSYKKANCGNCKNSLLDTKPKDVDQIAFNKHIENNDIPVVVDFWAPWCGPCLMMAPAFESAASEFPLQARFIKVDTQTHPAIASPYAIRGIPTIVIFKNSKEIDRRSGALPEQEIISWVGNYL